MQNRAVGVVLAIVVTAAGVGLRASRADEKDGKAARRGAQKLLGAARDHAAWIQANQEDGGLWKPPVAAMPRIVVAQFALLGLDAAERLGIEVAKDVYAKAAEAVLKLQEQAGPDVEPFP